MTTRETRNEIPVIYANLYKSIIYIIHIYIYIYILVNCIIPLSVLLLIYILVNCVYIQIGNLYAGLDGG